MTLCQISKHSKDMADCRFSRWRPAAILDFSKLEISTFDPVRRPNVRHYAKFRRSGDITWQFLIFQDDGRPLRVFGGLYDCAKFSCNQRSNFDSMRIKIF